MRYQIKNFSIAALLAFALAGCEEASQAIDDAQAAANQAVDGLQSKMESLDLESINLDQFGEAAETATALAASVQELANMELSSPEALLEVSDRISNAYSCLVEASSAATAEGIIEKITDSINNPDLVSAIETAVEKAEDAQQCVM